MTAHAGQVTRGPRGLAVPAGWRVLDERGPRPFTTNALLERPDGSRVRWTSRRHRKGLGLLETQEWRGPEVRRLLGGRASATSWWMGALFAIGAACFALGSFPPYFNAIEPEVVALTFFVGSIFFTSAAYLQFRESVSAPTGVLPTSPRPRRLASLVGWKPRSIDWWASGIQLVGTVFFNVSTFSAMRTNLDVDQERHLIWATDVWGSAGFLIASWLAYSEVNACIRPQSDGSVGWWIAALNMAGSVAFGFAALGARYLTTTGDPANIALVNAGTFVGAACFFGGAALLPIESARDRARVVDSRELRSVE